MGSAGGSLPWKIFPTSLTSERRREIIVFQQGEDDSLYTAWEGYKRLWKRCHMHGIELKTQMDIIYHSLNDASKGIIEAAYCGAFKRKSANEVKQLIEDLAKCNMKAPSDSSGSNNRTKGSGLIELNKMTAMEEKLDAIMHKLGNQEKIMHCTHEIGAVERDGIKISAKGPIDEVPFQVED